MLEAIEGARRFICLETYIYSADEVGRRFLAALIRAERRGAHVRVLVDALGSYGLPEGFFEPLRHAGGEFKLFNPIKVHRMGIRDHRKLLVCDNKVAFIGGFNISAVYDGDGVTCGWCDIGLQLEGPMVAALTVSFEHMFARAEFKHKRLFLLGNKGERKTVVSPNEQLLLSGPGRGRSPITRALRRDLAQAREAQIIVAYFLPTWRLRRSLVRISRMGGNLQLILAGKSDVPLSQLAGQSLYRRFLKTGAAIYEYQPQILHAKLFIIDDVVYVGSANLDPRSLNINYELMVRFHNPQIAAKARSIFANTLKHSSPISLDSWGKSRSLWRRIKQHWAYFVLVRLDPWVARQQWRALPD